jgi:hypothetical protein
MKDEQEPGSARLNNPGGDGGLPLGDFGPAGDELLIDGQEETFSRSEVEAGRVEHPVAAGGEGDAERRLPLRDLGAGGGAG